jgi:AmiR/NasT family two-component response regulator
VQAAELVASTVGTVMQEVSMRSELETVVSQLQTALESRATIDQAKGIVMARYGCDADEAFRILARLSSNANVKLREIAQRLVEEAAANG